MAGGAHDGGDGSLQDSATATATAPAPAPAPTAVPRATPARPHWLVFGGLALAVAFVDQATKAWILANVDPARPTPVIGDLVRLVQSRNTGALFGLFRDNATLFGLVSLAVIGAIVVYHRRSPRSRVLSVALGLLLGGAVGNLVDRLRLGYVVDFVDAGIGSLRWYTFNVADAAISAALLLLVAIALRPSLAAADPPAGSVAPARAERVDG